MKRRRFQEGGDIPDIEREPLRDSSGEIVRDSSGEPVMSGGSAKPKSSPKIEEVATVEKITMPRVESKGDTDMVELDTAGFSRTPLKMPETKKIAAAKPVAKAAKKDAKAEIARLQAYDKPLEKVTPETNIIGGPLLKGLKAAGAGLAAKLAPPISKARVEPSIPKIDTKALSAPIKSSSVTAKVQPKSELVKRRDVGPKLEAPRRTAEKDMGRARIETQINKRRQLARPSRSEEVIEMGMKRGGKVASASKRGDGIASRGKTRGRYI